MDDRLKPNSFTSYEVCLDKEKNKSEPIYLTDGVENKTVLFLRLQLPPN